MFSLQLFSFCLTQQFLVVIVVKGWLFHTAMDTELMLCNLLWLLAEVIKQDGFNWTVWRSHAVQPVHGQGAQAMEVQLFIQLLSWSRPLRFSLSSLSPSLPRTLWCKWKQQGSAKPLLSHAICFSQLNGHHWPMAGRKSFVCCLAFHAASLFKVSCLLS